MLRRSHKKSRGGCLECKRRHIKCDEHRPSCRLCTVSDRECSFTAQASQATLSTPGASSRSVSPGDINRPNTTPIFSDSPLTPSSFCNAEFSQPPAINDPGVDEPINFNHMELLAHVTIDKDIFNLGVDVGDYYAGLALGLRTSLKCPYLMHQILAYSARHLAYLHPGRSEFYLRQATTLKTRAVSLFTAVPMDVDQSNCIPIILFSAILGHHFLADTLAKRDSSRLDAFIAHFVQCAQTYRGVYTITLSAWPLLMESELAPILSLSAKFTSREPKGIDCQRASELVDNAPHLSEEDKADCGLAIQYLQVGFDAALEEDPKEMPVNPYQMISEWAMLVPPGFTRLLGSKRPEALVILAHYALLLHYGRHLWQVGDAGAYILRILGNYLGPEWNPWLDYPRQRVAQNL
ncbi:uncharacterized protein K460DRAFT_277402 [Cucurbitaria berberidis CBS 394.84]|uniref:Zn(2)-C6 fungal-type domain-containing protein n=1 Tax=Cucurbitaria berberidis CBS 394.84 TaxID=1168544 RepID=A0A9P4GJU6_9PLEO|nr:uncharacterized protein K460DRAFT_277402 [Cucurbitaria berberidis CBS 394.84]KAF1847603.1 hypothetical protein K460DRAFT_277402 [Cucurbitaria berberidis CBS 394.84]